MSPPLTSNGSSSQILNPSTSLRSTSPEPSKSLIPYWNNNLPPSEHTHECPTYLQNISQKDIDILSTPDSAYTPLSWSEIADIVKTNDLAVFSRTPSQLRRYREFSHHCCLKYGSIPNFILKERLRWTLPLEPVGKGYFENENDWKILWNDWPYGIDESIVHLVVWTKFALEEEQGTEFLALEARQAVEGLVEKVFESRVGKGNVLWFRNWSSLKSVGNLEHFHVLLYKPDPSFVNEVISG